MNEIYIYREQSFHIDPRDRFVLGRAGVGVRATVSPDKGAVQTYTSTVELVEAILNKEIVKASVEYDRLLNNPPEEL